MNWFAGRARLSASVLLLLVAGTSPAASAETASWYGSLSLTSDNIARGVSQSNRKPSSGAMLGFQSFGGWYAQMGVATVGKDQFEGGAGFKLTPEAGWNLDGGGDLRVGVALTGQVFPGAHGPWFGSLPPRLQQRAWTLQVSDYTTVEARATLGWKFATLSVSRSLTDYLGLAAQETGPLGSRLIESTGTTYVSLDVDWPVSESLTLSAGAGRLSVPGFEGLGYNDWRLSASVKAWGVTWSVTATGTGDNGNWRVASRTSDTGSTRVLGSVL